MFEQLVRPFENPQVLATRRVISTSTKQAAQLAIISWGDVGTLPTAIAETDPTSKTKDEIKEIVDDGVGDQNVEEIRNVERFKVKDKENEANFVTVERIRKIQFIKTDGTPTTLTYKLNTKTGVQTVTQSGGSTTNKNSFSLKRDATSSGSTVTNVDQ